jgi:hypothetical protein
MCWWKRTKWAEWINLNAVSSLNQGAVASSPLIAIYSRGSML